MKRRIAVAVVGVLVSAGVIVLQARQETGLSGTDYAEIHRLYAEYAYAFDSGNAEMYAAVFTPDGEFATTMGDLKGRTEIAALVEGRALRERPKILHVTTNVIINASAEGATGSAYLLALDLAQSPAVTGGGVYEDVIVRTSEGWRFKKRAYFAEPGPAAATESAAR